MSLDPAPMDARRGKRATLVLADISGYTGFLQGVAVAHPEQLDMGETPAGYPLMTTLLDDIVRTLTPPFELAKLEGDAVFGYADDAVFGLRGEAVIACLRGCYGSFRERLRQTEQGATCTCDVCISGARLDLKFILHHGGYVEQTIAGRTELLGSDVTLAHRMLKNEVVAQTGWQAYALLSSAAVDHLGVPALDSVEIDLEYDHLGRVKALVFPLGLDF